MCIRMYIFNFKKQQINKQAKNNNERRHKKQKKKREYLRKIDFKKLNLRPSGWKFFSSPTFSETTLFFFFCLSKAKWKKLCFDCFRCWGKKMWCVLRRTKNKWNNQGTMMSIIFVSSNEVSHFTQQEMH